MYEKRILITIIVELLIEKIVIEFSRVKKCVDI